jgi:hypothetical protein
MADYYWCLTHAEVEVGTTCRATDRLGPYASREEALAWRDRVDRRNDEWQAEDERWAAEWDEEDDDDG